MLDLLKRNLVNIAVALIIAISVCTGAYYSRGYDKQPPEPSTWRSESVESETEVSETISIDTEIEETETIFLEIETETEETETEIEETETVEYVSLGVFRITAYCSCKKCCGKWADSRPLDKDGNPIVYGASGSVLIPEYSVAVDPKVIPYGTKLYFNDNEYIAHDCGGAIKGKDLDLYFDSHEKARAWGVKKYEVFIVKK